MDPLSEEQLKEDAQSAYRETITAGEVAQLLGVSEWTVYDLTRRKMIPHIKIGRRVLYRRSSILAWLEAVCRIRKETNTAFIAPAGKISVRGWWSTKKT